LAILALMSAQIIFAQQCLPTMTLDIFFSNPRRLVSIPPHKFVRPPSWYYWLYVIEKYHFRIVSNGMKSIPKFIQIRPAFLESNHTERRTYKPAHKVFSAHGSAGRTPNNQSPEEPTSKTWCI
jgi:hypothetical protein